MTKFVKPVPVDWSPVMHILDELSDGTHSLIEMSYMAAHYDGKVFVESLLFLLDRKLVEVSVRAGTSEPIPQDRWPELLRSAFADPSVDPGTIAPLELDLSPQGEQVLRLFNIGHPPYSS